MFSERISSDFVPACFVSASKYHFAVCFHACYILHVFHCTWCVLSSWLLINGHEWMTVQSNVTASYLRPYVASCVCYFWEMTSSRHDVTVSFGCEILLCLYCLCCLWLLTMGKFLERLKLRRSKNNENGKSSKKDDCDVYSRLGVIFRPLMTGTFPSANTAIRIVTLPCLNPI